MANLKLWQWIVIIIVFGIVARTVFSLLYGKELLAANQAAQEKEDARQAEIWAKMREAY